MFRAPRSDVHCLLESGHHAITVVHKRNNCLHHQHQAHACLVMKAAEQDMPSTLPSRCSGCVQRLLPHLPTDLSHLCCLVLLTPTASLYCCRP
jgi:hypothetical protein